MADNEVMATRYPALKRHKIPHEVVITNHLLESLMRIAETKPFLDENLSRPQELKLVRRAKIRAITYSNQIEGNELGEKEVTALLKGRRVAGSPKDVKEIQNYQEALDYVEKIAQDSRPLKNSDMCDVQRLVTHDLLPAKQSGKIRTIPVSIVNAGTGQVLEQCPEPHALRELLGDLWLWLEDHKDFNPFALAFAFHFIAVSIHPFADGNGRTVRLMQHLLLLRQGQDLARFVPSETVIMQSRDEYYGAIRQSRKLKKLDPIVEYLAECFAESAEEVVREGQKLLRETAGKSPEMRQQKILVKAAKFEDFTIRDVVEWLPQVPRRTLERDLAALVLRRDLKAIGENRARKYVRRKR